MKLISATSILLISSSGVARAMLGPGYEDNMHCPPGSCSLLVNPHPGPKSSYTKCYDETTDQTTEAVWTGFRTQVEAPKGWIEDPEECDVAPTPAPSTPTHKNIDKPGGLCTKDSDCHTTIRYAVPLDAIGPRLCECYAASWRLPFDETEGQTDVMMAMCDPGACDRFEAYCPLASDDNGMAECALRPIDTSSSSTSSSEDSPRSRPKKHTRSTTSSSASTSSDDPPSISKKRTGSITKSSSTSTSSDESPPSNQIKKKRRPAYLLSAASTSASSDDSSTGIVSPTPAPPAPVQAVAEM